MIGNWRTKITEPHVILAANNGFGVTGGRVEPATMPGRSRKKGNRKPPVNWERNA